MHSLSHDYLARLRFEARQLATLRALGEYRGKQRLYFAQSPEVLNDLRQVAVVESTESSNRLEGVVVAASRLKSLVLKNATPKSRSEQEVAGCRDAEKGSEKGSGKGVRALFSPSSRRHHGNFRKGL